MDNPALLRGSGAPPASFESRHAGGTPCTTTPGAFYLLSGLAAMMFGNRIALAWLTAMAILWASSARGQQPALSGPAGIRPAESGPCATSCPDCRSLQQRWREMEEGANSLGPRLGEGQDPAADSCESWLQGIVPPKRVTACESWLCRPCSIGWFVGLGQGSPLIYDWVGLNQGLYAGIRLGWDFEESWAVETRFAYASTGLHDSARAKEIQWQLDTAAGYPVTSPYRGRFDNREADVFHWDLDLVYYPLGDTWLRPYLLFGVGVTDIHVTDRLNTLNHRFAFSLPLGLGMKYRVSEALAVRLDLIDDIGFLGNGMETQNYLSLTFGMEVRFGGPRKTYWPWNPTTHLW